MSGTDLPNGTEARKGAVDAIKGFVRSRNGNVSQDLDEAYERVSRLGGTPLGVALDNELYGVIYLKRYYQARNAGTFRPNATHGSQKRHVDGR